MVNYFYYDKEKDIYKGKVKSSEVKISKDSIIQILYLEQNPNRHLVITLGRKGKLGQTRY